MQGKRNNVKALIEEAYLRLLTKKNYLDISVSDLTKEAGVGRASYYRLFNSFEDIVVDIVEKFYARAAKEIVPVVINNGDDLWKSLILYLCNYFKSGSSVVTSVKPENVSFVLTRILNRFNDFKIESLNTNQKYIALANMSMVLGIITYWVNDGYKEPVDQIVEILIPLIKSNVETIK